MDSVADFAAYAADLAAGKVADPRSTNGAHVKPAPPPTPTPAAPPTPTPAAPPMLIVEAAVAEWARPLPPAIGTGLAGLDEAIGGGLQPESAHLLLGPTGRGKTGFAIQVCRHIATTRTVVYLSTELSRRQVIARVAAQVLGRGWREVMQWEPARAAEVAKAVGLLRMRVAELGARPVTEMLDAVAQAEGEAPILLLDYIQSAARRGAPEDYRHANAQLSDLILAWVRATRSAALVVSSVGRGWHLESDNRTASDFVTAAKESGDLEFDAAAVMFLDCQPPPLGGYSPARLHVAKARMGATATIGLRFDGPTGTFTPDGSAALSVDQRRALDAIEAGAASVDEVRKVIGGRTGTVGELVRALLALGLIERNTRGLRPKVAI